MSRSHLAIFTFAFLGLVACSSDGGSLPDPDGPPGADALVADSPPVDSPIDTPPAPPMITITGTALSRGLQGAQPVADAVIAGYRNSDSATPIAMTTTNAQGNFTLTISTGGVALDGYLKATKATFLETYLYPPTPIATDTIAPINMISSSLLPFLSAFTGVTQQAGAAIVALVVVDGATAQSTPVDGATVSSTPASGAYRYSDPQNGFPGDAAITQTFTDGIAYMFNVPGDAVVSVSALKPGSTFKSHNVKAWANQLTTTIITP